MITIYNHKTQFAFSTKNTAEAGTAIGCELNIFDLRSQRECFSAQPYKVFFEFSQIIPEEAITCYALILTKEIISFNSDRQR